MPPKKKQQEKLEQQEQVKQMINSRKEQRLGVLLLNGFRYLYKVTLLVCLYRIFLDHTEVIENRWIYR